MVARVMEREHQQVVSISLSLLIPIPIPDSPLLEVRGVATNNFHLPPDWLVIVELISHRSVSLLDRSNRVNLRLDTCRRSLDVNSESQIWRFF